MESSLRLLILALAFLATLPTLPIQAGQVLDRIRSTNTLRCGAESRPGLVHVAPDKTASGLLLDLCHAIGAAVLPPNGHIEFTIYDASKDYDAVRAGTDDVFFLTAAEALEEDLMDKIVPGPTVFNLTTNVMVFTDTPVRQLKDLAGKAICFPQGSGSHRHLEAWFARNRLDFIHMGFQEEAEMYDAYASNKCLGVAGEGTFLAAARSDPAGGEPHGRILSEPLAVFPLFAATSTSDGILSAVVAWTMHTVIRSEVPAEKWTAGGLDALKITGAGLGLAPDWQSRVVKAVGTYADIFGRNLGTSSPLKLERGVNAQLTSGGLLLAPFDE